MVIVEYFLPLVVGQIKFAILILEEQGEYTPFEIISIFFLLFGNLFPTILEPSFKSIFTSFIKPLVKFVSNEPSVPKNKLLLSIFIFKFLE